MGKHTSGKIVAEKLGAELVDINKVAIDNTVAARKTDHGLDIDVKKLSRLIDKILISDRDLILVGHLAPYVIKPAGVGMVAVLRRSPYALEKTLEDRGYTFSKVRENVSSEILGVSLYDAIESFGKRKIAEFDTTDKRPEDTGGEIMETVKKKLPRRTGIVDWLSLVAEKDDIHRFFDY